MVAIDNLPFALLMTFSPTKGEGWTESIIAVLLILTFGISLLLNKNIPDYFVGLIGLILGFYFGNQNTKYQDF